LAFAGSQQCCSNSLLTPRPYRTGLQSPLNISATNKNDTTGVPFSFVGGAGTPELSALARVTRQRALPMPPLMPPNRPPVGFHHCTPKFSRLSIGAGSRGVFYVLHIDT
jgi:hypothetical protein